MSFDTLTPAAESWCCDGYRTGTWILLIRGVVRVPNRRDTRGLPGFPTDSSGEFFRADFSD